MILIITIIIIIYAWKKYSHLGHAIKQKSKKKASNPKGIKCHCLGF